MSFLTGYEWSEKQRQKCGFCKGVIPWNKGKKGVYSKETLEIWSKQRKGRISAFKGKKHTSETIIKLREIAKKRLIHKGPKGKPWSEARRKAQELLARVKPSRTKPIKKNGKIYSIDWHEIRKSVYRRDGWICQECGVHCSKKMQIQCHHIDYDTTNNDWSNLITLCSSCHAKTNFQRLDWENHYKNIMKGRGLTIFVN